MIKIEHRLPSCTELSCFCDVIILKNGSQRQTLTLKEPSQAATAKDKPSRKRLAGEEEEQAEEQAEGENSLSPCYL